MPARDTNVGAVGDSRVARWSLRTVALAYLALILLLPLAFILYRTFEHGFDTFWTAVTSEQALHALWLTVLITAITVPLNAISTKSPSRNERSSSTGDSSAMSS